MELSLRSLNRIRDTTDESSNYFAFNFNEGFTKLLFQEMPPRPHRSICINPPSQPNHTRVLNRVRNANLHPKELDSENTGTCRTQKWRKKKARKKKTKSTLDTSPPVQRQLWPKAVQAEAPNPGPKSAASTTGRATVSDLTDLGSAGAARGTNQRPPERRCGLGRRTHQACVLTPLGAHKSFRLYDRFVGRFGRRGVPRAVTAGLPCPRGRGRRQKELPACEGKRQAPAGAREKAAAGERPARRGPWAAAPWARRGPARLASPRWSSPSSSGPPSCCPPPAAAASWGAWRGGRSGLSSRSGALRAVGRAGRSGTGGEGTGQQRRRRRGGATDPGRGARWERNARRAARSKRGSARGPNCLPAGTARRSDGRALRRRHGGRGLRWPGAPRPAAGGRSPRWAAAPRGGRGCVESVCLRSLARLRRRPLAVRGGRAPPPPRPRPLRGSCLAGRGNG